MEQKTKNILYIVSGILLFLIILAAYFYYQGKKQTTIAKLPLDDPNNPKSSTSTDADISSIATKLYDDMKGISFAGHNNGVWERSLTLSDTDFTKLYNFFNTKYQADSGETLTQWVNGEQDWTDLTWGSLRDSFAERLGKLNLK